MITDYTIFIKTILDNSKGDMKADKRRTNFVTLNDNKFKVDVLAQCRS